MQSTDPYYAVIFTSRKKPDNNGYSETADHMEELARQQPGFIGIEHAQSEISITISYWESPEAIAAWKANVDHQEAQQRGRKDWYECYQVRVCKVEREYGFGNF